MIRRKIISSAGDYINVVAEIAKEEQKTQNEQKELRPPVLWFRGQGNAAHDLIPKMFRDKTRARSEKYSSLHYKEDIRTQHYIAKNFHLLSAEPSSRIEWLEIMQHHELGTRLLDWSESSIHSLLFALEPFLNEKYTDEDRQKCVPCVWVLKPGKLNRYIMDYLKKDTGFVTKLLEELSLTADERTKVEEKLKIYGNWDEFASTKETEHMDFIYNLSSINDEILRDRGRIKELLRDGEVMNPYFYLLFRIYSDGYLLDNRELPPLSVVLPYHSERIKAQKGVFTVFPFYKEKKDDDSLRGLGINPDALNRRTCAQDCLYQLVIKNPQKVALQLVENGMNDSWLYPEMPIVSAEIEKRRVL